MALPGVTFTGLAAYIASKAALIHHARTLAVEWGMVANWRSNPTDRSNSHMDIMMPALETATKKYPALEVTVTDALDDIKVFIGLAKS